MFHIAAHQREHILRRFACGTSTTAHAHTWSRRSYAPMYIHDPEMASYRAALEQRFPEYVVAFDVVFESRGNEVAWHVDHESLGPFDVPDRWRAVRDHHFLTAHVNLTSDGGALLTHPRTLLSWIYFWIVSTFGIFSVAHTFLVALTRPLLAAWHSRHDARPGVVNVFDNTRLHAVTAGGPRVSYVVRLVKRGVALTPASVEEGVARSAACVAFAPLRAVVQTSVDVGEVPWRSVFHPAGAD